MHRAGLKRLVLITMTACLALAWVAHAGAQGPALTQQQRATLAAIPLVTDDLPDGYRFVGEGFLNADSVAVPNIAPDALVGSGFETMYVSVYDNADAGGTITSYVSAWTDAGAAEAGFALLEDESRTAPGAGLTDAELDAGSGSAELTIGTVDANGISRAIADATFVVDRYVVGVNVETPADAAMDEAGVRALAATLEGRADAALAGQSPAGTNLSLPQVVLDIRPLGTEVQAGYLSASEAEALYGVSGSSLSGIGTTWVSGVAAGGGAPFVVIAASTFENPDNAARVVAQSADLMPVTIALQPVDFGVDGAGSAKGYQYTSAASADGTPDSFRGVIQIASTVVVVDVQGAPSVDVAQAAVSSLLSGQMACTADSCSLPEIDLGG